MTKTTKTKTSWAVVARTNPSGEGTILSLHERRRDARRTASDVTTDWSSHGWHTSSQWHQVDVVRTSEPLGAAVPWPRNCETDHEENNLDGEWIQQIICPVVPLDDGVLLAGLAAWHSDAQAAQRTLHAMEVDGDSGEYVMTEAGIRRLLEQRAGIEAARKNFPDDLPGLRSVAHACRVEQDILDRALELCRRHHRETFSRAEYAFGMEGGQ